MDQLYYMLLTLIIGLNVLLLIINLHIDRLELTKWK